MVRQEPIARPVGGWPSDPILINLVLDALPPDFRLKMTAGGLRADRGTGGKRDSCFGEMPAPKTKIPSSTTLGSNCLVWDARRDPREIMPDSVGSRKSLHFKD